MRTPRRTIQQLLKGLSSNPSTDAAKPLFESMEPRVMMSATAASIDLDTAARTLYSGQGGSLTRSALEDGGATLRLSGNNWQKIAFPYTLTANTILEFDFKAGPTAEIHGIGFDTDNKESSEQTFQIGGSQDWGIGAGIQATAGADGWTHYRIEVGKSMTGVVQYLTFVQDHDAAGTPESRFSNIKVYENGQTPPPDDNGGGDPDNDPDPNPNPTPVPSTPGTAIDFSKYTFTDYTAEQGVGAPAQVLSGGGVVKLPANTWQKINFPYNVTADTVLEFDFAAPKQGEVQGVGFDTDSDMSPDLFFQLYGTQTWGISDYKQYDGAGAYQHFVIPIGKFFQGQMQFLVFGNDNDASPASAESLYRNLKVFEDPAIAPVGQQPLNLEQYQVLPYMVSRRGAEGSAAVSADGSGVNVSGWRRISLPYGVTKNTVLEFDYRTSATSGEVAGIGFDDDDSVSSDRDFQVWGSRDWAIDQDNYTTTGQWKHYKINVGDYFTGDMLYLVMFHDNDVVNNGTPLGSSDFANIKVYEGPSRAPATITVSTSSQLRAAARAAGPGTQILLQPGTYSGGVYLADLQGTADKHIVIRAADPNNRPVFSGGSDVFKLSDAAYVDIRDIVFQNGGANGINIDDAGSKFTPTHHITLENIVVRNTGPDGNADGIKLSGVQDFVLRNVTVQGWGSSYGSGIDMVGCSDGLIENSTFRSGDNTGHSGVQVKGGTHDVIIRNNKFDHAGQRAVQVGGNTDQGAFRPGLTSYEAKDITIEGNVFVGSQTPLLFSNSVDTIVKYNTFYKPTTYLMRIVQEDFRPGMAKASGTVFTDNLFVYTGSRGVNYGGSTAASTFVFARNFWFRTDNPAASKPSLPSTETSGVYGKDPLFVNAAGGDFRLKAGSPASKYGAYATR